MNKFIKYIFYITVFLMMTLPCQADTIEDAANIDLSEEQSNTWINSGDSLEDAVEVHNVAVWKVQEDELINMYADPFVLRRTDKSYDSWITFGIDYMSDVNITIYTWPSNETTLSFYLSKDGEEWTETEFSVNTYTDDDKWTKIIYENHEIFGMKYLKIVFPEVDEAIDDWWNPYLGEITAVLAAPVLLDIETDVPAELTIPRYDSIVYNLSAEAVDQIGNPINAEIIWDSITELPDGVSLTEDGKLTIESGCIADAGISLCVTVTDSDDNVLEKTIDISLRSAVLGDSNTDMKIDRLDLDYALDQYGMKSDAGNWKDIRLADVDGDGCIDVTDIAYIAYMCKPDDETDNI